MEKRGGEGGGERGGKGENPNARNNFKLDLRRAAVEGPDARETRKVHSSSLCVTAKSRNSPRHCEILSCILLYMYISPEISLYHSRRSE